MEIFRSYVGIKQKPENLLEQSVQIDKLTILMLTRWSSIRHLLKFLMLTVLESFTC